MDAIKGLAEGLTAAKNAQDVAETLKAFDAEKETDLQLRRAFCLWASAAAEGSPPNWQTFAENQIGISADDPFDEKIQELNNAVVLAENNPPVAQRYVKGCLLDGILK